MTRVAEQDPTKTIVSRLLTGEVAALSRTISILESCGDAADRLATALRPRAGEARVLAFSGPPGVGKSSLISAFISKLRARGEPVAVLAVDPSSPLSGGALLGDRTRMGVHSGDQGVFIRSIAARGHLGGLALAIPSILDAVDAAGWPTIILEPVGAGQSEIEIVEYADVKVVVNAPGLGDGVQALKAGLLEIADVLVVNKCDLPMADRTVQQLVSMLHLRKEGLQNVAVVSTSATKDRGLEQLDEAISTCLEAEQNEGRDVRIARRLSGLLRQRAEAAFRERMFALPAEVLVGLCTKVRLGALTLAEAEKQILELAVCQSVS